jgi:hypothetical protein
MLKRPRARPRGWRPNKRTDEEKYEFLLLRPQHGLIEPSWNVMAFLTNTITLCIANSYREYNFSDVGSLKMPKNSIISAASNDPNVVRPKKEERVSRGAKALQSQTNVRRGIPRDGWLQPTAVRDRKKEREISNIPASVKICLPNKRCVHVDPSSSDCIRGKMFPRSA